MEKRLLNLSVAKSCPASWNTMSGNDKTRNCSHCRKNVHNISAMTEDEILSFIEKQTETPCIRYYKRPDGTIVTADCSKQELPRLKVFQYAAAIFTFLSPFFLFIGCNKKVERHIMGDMEAPVVGKMQAPVQQVNPKQKKIPVQNSPQKVEPIEVEMGEMIEEMGDMHVPGEGE
ncbi:MAG: hypothetical protein HRT89_00315 [Lentisphaeria bacterium]|nr:hypothetical protein [Lentisphaeria bacterium]NQZ66486.1 hypothetical protein [Lentisphaeria bacterium]